MVDVDEGESSVTGSLGSVTLSPSGATSSSEADAVVERCLPLPLLLNLENGLLNCTLGAAGLEARCLAGLVGLLRIRLRRPLLGAGTPVSLFPETSFSSTGISSGTFGSACSDTSTCSVCASGDSVVVSSDGASDEGAAAGFLCLLNKLLLRDPLFRENRLLRLLDKTVVDEAAEATLDALWLSTTLEGVTDLCVVVVDLVFPPNLLPLNRLAPNLL